MFKFSTCSMTALLIFAPAMMQAQGATGAIAGSADPGAQIVVTGVDSGAVIGIMASCDGTFKAENLKPGRYAIAEGGAHHATRKLSVDAGATAHVDLGAPSADAMRACTEKAKKG
jgi:hypothetical protein